jgi:hypothetical protein
MTAGGAKSVGREFATGKERKRRFAAAKPDVRGIRVPRRGDPRKDG